jgi:hypothetical protein
VRDLGASRRDGAAPGEGGAAADARGGGDPATGAVQIATGQPNLRELAVSRAGVFWTRDEVLLGPGGATLPGGLVMAGGPGRGPIVVAERLNHPWGLAATGDRLYWLASYDAALAEVAVPLSGAPTPRVLLTSKVPLDGPLVTDDTSPYLFFAAAAESPGGGARLLRLNKSGDPGLTTIATDPTGRPLHLVLHAGHLYWVTTEGASQIEEERSHLRRVSVDGAGAITLATERGRVGGLAATGDEIYWTNALTRELRRASLAGGAVATVAKGLAPFGALATDGRFAYAAQGSGILKISLAGEGSSVFAERPGLLVDRIVTDASYVYWTERDASFMQGDVWRKPL